MEQSGQMMNVKGMKVEIPPETDENTSGGVSKCHVSPPSGAAGGGSGLARQPSIPKGGSCLCSPTSHAGSFRCRLHRNPTGPALQRTKSIDSKAQIQN